MEINEYKIRLSGSANLPQPLSDTEKFIDLTIKNATLAGDQDIRDNNDGSKNLIYKIKITGESEITILHEQDIIKAEKKKSQSQKLRSIIFEYYNQQYSGNNEFEQFYTQELSNVIKKYQDLLI